MASDDRRSVPDTRYSILGTRCSVLEHTSDSVSLGPIAIDFFGGEGPGVFWSSLPTMTSPITLARAYRNTLLPACLPFSIFPFPFLPFLTALPARASRLSNRSPREYSSASFGNEIAYSGKEKIPRNLEPRWRYSLIFDNPTGFGSSAFERAV